MGVVRVGRARSVSSGKERERVVCRVGKRERG